MPGFRRVVLISLSLLVNASGMTHAHAQGFSRGLDPRLFERQDIADRQEADLAAGRFGLELHREEGDRTIELVRFKGRPLYLQTLSNVAAAQSVALPALWPMGDLGLNLTGAGMNLAIWDGGTPRITHSELVNRVTLRDSEPMGSHPTHVAGTMIGSGVLPEARGMAFQAHLDAYGWTNDRSEMASAAAAGLLVSNHSYGYIAGWYNNGGTWYWYGRTNLSQTNDASFGYYDEMASSWDAISYNAPYYLIVKAAGNDRGEGPAPGTAHRVWTSTGWQTSTASRDKDGGSSGFDCISSDSTMKNALVVGAVNDVTGARAPGNIGMSSFSSWGPTDDGRIKPDLVGNGVGLTSCVSDTDSSYGNWSGTSMATPNVSGTMAILIQHYRNTHNIANPRSATIKGIAIHTANEAGPSEGPDYMFGWGLLNARDAAKVITSDVSAPMTVQELELSSGQTQTFTINATSGVAIRATLSWTDPSRPPFAAALNNRTPVLVNDLDLRLIREQNVLMPWRLNPASPSAAATRGDNAVDNVEQINLANPVTGAYRITVSAKGTALKPSGKQQYSLIVTGASFSNPI